MLYFVIHVALDYLTGTGLILRLGSNASEATLHIMGYDTQ